MTMKAGRELDALIAEKVMGCPRDKIYYSVGDVQWITEALDFYSTDIADAWRVVEHFLEMNGEDGHYRKERFILSIGEEGMGDLVRWRSAHAAHIICAAALRAMDVVVE
jgi:hypothetical protein